MTELLAEPGQRHRGDLAFRRYEHAVARLDERIVAQTGSSHSPAAAQAMQRLDRLESFLAFLDIPHLACPVIHVAGTSGKGSTAAMIAAMLTASEYRTGLHVSPYLQAATEKLQINGAMIEGNRFADLVDELFAAEAAWGGARLSYGELWAVLVFLTFARERVDIAVIETGSGGRFDLTNVVEPVLSVITTVGFDHTETLGRTLEEIAWHKAGIIKAGVPVVTGVTNAAPLAVIRREAVALNAPLTVVSPSGMTSFQQQNAAIAEAAASLLASQGFTIARNKGENAIATARLPGRAETMQQGPTVLIDCAHNPQKIAALVAALPLLLPRSHGSRLIVVLGILGSKDVAAIAASIASIAGVIIVTAPQVSGKPALDPQRLATELRNTGFSGELIVEPDVAAATSLAINRCVVERGDAVLVTGSLYLAGEAREGWFATRDIVLQQTSWPA